MSCWQLVLLRRFLVRIKELKYFKQKLKKAMKTEKQFWKRNRQLLLAAGVLLAGSSAFVSCSDV